MADDDKKPCPPATVGPSWQHITGVALGIASLTLAGLIPATAPVLGPFGAGLLLASNPKRLFRRKKTP